jgi:hypothetical protein
MFRFRSNRDPAPEHQFEEHYLNRQHMEEQMNKIKLEFKTMGHEVQTKMREVLEQLRRELREVAG